MVFEDGCTASSLSATVETCYLVAMHFDLETYESQTFEKLDLKGARAEDIAFYDCRFEDCHLNEASLKRSRFSACTFSDCDLSMVDVTDVEFSDTHFEKTIAVGVNWSVIAQNTPLAVGLDFSGCVLKYAVFRGLDLQGRSFADCLAQEVDFSDSNLVGASFTGSDLQGSVFQNCDLSKANFTGAKNYQINVLHTKVKGAKFAVPEVLGLLAGLGIELDA